MMRVSSVPVEVAHSWIDYLTAWSTVTAALLALTAILYAWTEAKRSDARLRRERRLYYEPELLQRLAQVIPVEDRSAVVRRQITGILAALPGQELPLLRAFVHVREPDAAHAELDRIASRFRQEHPDLAGSDERQLQWNSLAYGDRNHEPRWAREVNEAIRARLEDLSPR